MGTSDYARKELTDAGYFSAESDYNGLLGEAVMELVDVFSKQGHSDMSAPIVVDLFRRVALNQPLKPIMCSDDEWGDVDGYFYQNKRCSAVFKQSEDGPPYYLDAIIWRTPNGGTWTGLAKSASGIMYQSRQYIKTPFYPKSFYVDVVELKVGEDGFEFFINDDKQLDAVFEYYSQYPAENN